MEKLSLKLTCMCDLMRCPGLSHETPTCVEIHRTGLSLVQCSTEN